MKKVIIDKDGGVSGIKVLTEKEFASNVTELKKAWKDRPRLKFGCRHSITADWNFPVYIKAKVQHKYGVTEDWAVATFFHDPLSQFLHAERCLKCGGYILYWCDKAD
jgi:hypothetical protein